ncbi:hypothetical protein OsJ_13319 [Oryza sativa Japonica Group]|uniref:DUF3615 domain-containing protein n=3 Tax=Oryza TaxID=4527 RepID=A3APL7_ORYSJ|nr:hypothetical protein [Oryza sativa Japonica Group]ABF99821.1 hypothetical protein LOC_Os03g62530 [Oryza sativa Japonica Group]EAZ29256.1 hypothetical protein OsJ_13319 [Oryza sativa Japonica Group]KAF2942263.1 hypothetical protein DAI22_03g409500 [Oryza sativa Japonica Group]
MGSLVSRLMATCVQEEKELEEKEEEEVEEEDENEEEEEEEEEDPQPYVPSRPLPSEEVRDGYSIREAHAALDYYNANHTGAEYELVKPLMAACVFFKRRMWYHVSLLARRKDQTTAPPIEYFFAELREGASDSFIVEACTMIENPQSCSGNKCSLCPTRYEIVHPSEEELLCGKEGDVKDFLRLRNLSPLPFTCPVTVPEIEIVVEK